MIEGNCSSLSSGRRTIDVAILEFLQKAVGDM